MIIDYARVGGYLCLLTLCHFAVDWICQSHDEAMRKTREWRVRARHCLIYTAPFAVILFRTSWHPAWSGLATAVVFLSHFVEDTYIPVLWWAKYVRRPPEMARRLVWWPPGEPEKEKWTIFENGRRRDSHISKTEEVILAALEGGESVSEAQRRLDLDGFIQFVSEPLGKILLIAVDQIVHIAFLLPVAYMLAARP